MNEVVEPAAAAAERDRTALPYRRYWTALYRRDVPAAAAIVRDCLDHVPPARIYLHLFEPALALSGTLWAEGRIHHRDEHFVTYHTLRLMRQVRHLFVSTRPAGPLAIVTSAGQESHAIGLRMVCDFLQADNWRIHWLPSNDRPVVRQAVKRLQPDALLISIGLDLGLAPAKRVIADAREAGLTGLVVVGGAAINRDPARVQAIGADMTALNGFLLNRQLRGRRTSRTSA